MSISENQLNKYVYILLEHNLYSIVECYRGNAGQVECVVTLNPPDQPLFLLVCRAPVTSSTARVLYHLDTAPWLPVPKNFF